MKQFLKVLKFELNNYFKNKSFVVVTLLLMVLAIGGVAAPTIYQTVTGKGNSSSKGQENLESQQESNEESRGKLILACDVTMSSLPADIQKMMPGYEWEIITDTTEENLEQVKKQVEAGQVDGGFVLEDWMKYTYVVENLSMQDSAEQQFSEILKMANRNRFLSASGVDTAEFEMINAQEPQGEQLILGKDSISNYLYTYVMVFILYCLILFYGQMIATTVTTEKSNRAIEILVTSVSSTSLIFGKVLAGAIAGIVQVGLILGGGVLSYRFFGSGWGGMLDMLFDIPMASWLIFLVFGLLGYLLYAFLFGMLGALVSKTEDISKSATPVTMIFIAAFILVIVNLSNVDGLVMKIGSYVPFTSCMAMLARISMGGVAAWEIILSAVILAVSCLAVGWLAAKIFRFGTLMYGNPIKLSKAIKQLKNQN